MPEQINEEINNEEIEMIYLKNQPKNITPKKARKSLFVSFAEYPDKVQMHLGPGREEIVNYFITRNGDVLKFSPVRNEMKVLVKTVRKDGNIVVGINGKVVLLHNILVETFSNRIKNHMAYFVKHRNGIKADCALNNLIVYESKKPQV